MSTSLEQGHAAWVWLDLNGHGQRWHLAVPVQRDNWDAVEEDDVEACRWQALFPLYDDYRCEIEELRGSPERRIVYPATSPTDDEVAVARAELEEDAA